MKLLKFSAVWCGPCQTMARNLKADFDACEVVELDVDDDANDELVEKYGITNIPAMFLVGDDGETLEKWVGVVPVSEIADAVAKHSK